MENFVVSARKYRPQNFGTVVGQAHITTTLKNAIKNNQLAHAFLFCGPRGVGKTTCARILAKTINCENPGKDGEACNTCSSCTAFDGGGSLNIHELDAASNNSVDDIRSLVEQVRFAPQAGKYKVYIVDEVHMLSAAAFNAFLKTLEEPPSYAIFILATTEKHKILPTILSRCQIFDFKRITNNDTVEHLQEICEKETINAEKIALHLIAQKSEGCMRDSLSILDKIVSFTNGEVSYKNTLEHLNILDEDYYFKLFDFIQTQDVGSALLMYDEINRKGFEGDTVINGFAEFLRNIMVSSDPRVLTLLEVADDFKQKYLKAAESTNNGFVVSALNILNEAEINFKQARNKRLHVELMLIKLCYLQQALELIQNDEGVIKKKLTAASKSLKFRALPVVKSTQTAATQPAEGAKLVIQTPIQPPPTTAITKPVVNSPMPPNTTATSTVPPIIPSVSLGSLSKIRQKVAQQSNSEVLPIPVEMERLQQAWEAFIEKLKQVNNNTGVSNFQVAKLQVINSNSFEITAISEINKSFIENERAELILHMQGWFNDRTLTYKIQVEEQPEDPTPQEVTLTRKQIYLKMVEEFPLVQELRDRLKLDLE
ncbi:MAG: hypothetical protein RLY16_2848 [Bacteroidota bacterium]|jgi:DNA polymerase-3 subunit gamma/tau